jgi:competence protein ComEC
VSPSDPLRSAATRSAPIRAAASRSPAEFAHATLRRHPWHIGMAALGTGLALAERGDGLVLLLGAVGSAAFALAKAPRLAAAAAALLLAGAAAGHERLVALDRPGDAVRDGRHVSLRVHLFTLPRPGPFGSSAEAGVVGGRLAGARLLARAPRWAPFPRLLAIGDELIVTGELRALRSRGPPSGYEDYLRGRGVDAELQVDRVRATGRRRGGLAGALGRMRERAQRAVVAGLPPERAALLRGMVLGEDEQIAEATRDDWRDAGLAHLLAVSGQNVMLLTTLALPMLAMAGAGLGVRLLVLTGLIAVYVPLAGAGPSLQRAGVMGLAGIVAMAASRPASRWYALLLAATATLAWNPRSWADPGWQLSFAAVAGILVAGVPLQAALRRAVRELVPERAARGGKRAARALLLALADGVAITLAATCATAPLLAHHFGYVPLAGLPANLLALPAVAPAMWLGMLKVALGELPVTAPLAGVIGVIAGPPVGYLAALAERCADLPGARVDVSLASAPAVLAAYGGLVLGAAVLLRAVGRVEERVPSLAFAWRVLPKGRRMAVAAVLAAGALAAASVVLTGPRPPTRFTVRFLDVGQGDAVLIQHPDGTAVLFDGGPPEGGVTRLLRRAGVRRLALVVATHASRDHHGGLPAVLERFPVEALLDGGDGTADPSFRALERQAERRGIRRIPAIAPLTLTLGELTIRVLSPPPRPPGPIPEDPNPRAVVAIVSCRGFDLLLSADAESDALLPLDLPDVDAMKVPHHGSADPGLPELLDRLAPEVAGIEVGAHNLYGHPAPSTLAALRRAGVTTYRTDLDGTISLVPRLD